MSFWVILRNIGTIIQFFKAFEAIISGVIESKSVPPADQVKALLDKAEDLLDSGVIDIPNVDEKAICEALKQIEQQLLSSPK